jgi:hypothetical protein
MGRLYSTVQIEADFRSNLPEGRGKSGSVVEKFEMQRTYAGEAIPVSK